MRMVHLSLYGEGLLVPLSREVGEGQAMRAAWPLLPVLLLLLLLLLFLLLLLLLLPMLYCWPGGASREAGGRGGGACSVQRLFLTERAHRQIKC